MNSSSFGKEAGLQIVLKLFLPFCPEGSVSEFIDTSVIVATYGLIKFLQQGRDIESGNETISLTEHKVRRCFI